MSNSQSDSRQEGRACSGSGRGADSSLAANVKNDNVSGCSRKPNGKASNTSNHPAVAAAVSKGSDHVNQPQPHFQQNFSSWASTAGGNAVPAAVHGMPAEAYNNYYYNTAAVATFSPFSGDIRDSIASIWSRTSPSGGEGIAAAISGGYGQFANATADNSPAATAGQFAANLTGHFATSELGMFGGAGASDFAAYGQQYGYGPQYTQWPNGESSNGGSGGNPRDPSYVQQEGFPSHHGVHQGVGEAQQGLEAMKLSSRSKRESNGYGLGHNSQASATKKMSWANVASQPAKPQPAPAKAKKPGVLAPPTIISAASSKPLQPASLAPPVLPVPVQSVVSEMMNEGGGVGMSVPPQQHQMPPAVSPHHRGPINGSPYIGPPPPGHHPSPYHPMPMAPHGGMVHGHHAGPPHFPGPYRHHHRGPPPSGQRGPLRATAALVTNGVSVSSMSGRPAAAAGHSVVSENSDSNSGGGVPPVKHPVLENLKNVNDYNPKSFDLSTNGARFFVIKSFSEDDIHRSIKYEIWCSTDHGNKRLDAAFRERNGQGPIYLLFSVNGSGHFCGVAEMLSGVDYSNTSSGVWVQDKFKGQFKVKWIYVKDVPNMQLRHIRLENNENKPVTNSRDTQEVLFEKGKMVLKAIHQFKHLTSIFDDFVHYEKRQKEEEGKKAAAHVPGVNSDGRDYRGGGGGGHMRHDGHPSRGSDFRGGHGYRDHHRGGGYRENDHHGYDGHRGGHIDDGPPHHHRDGVGVGGGNRGKAQN